VQSVAGTAATILKWDCRGPEDGSTFTTRTGGDFVGWMRRLWSFETVTTDSLHAAIFADLYGIPWRPMRWEPKWADHFGMLKLPDRPRDFVLSDRGRLAEQVEKMRAAAGELQAFVQSLSDGTTRESCSTSGPSPRPSPLNTGEREKAGGDARAPGTVAAACAHHLAGRRAEAEAICRQLLMAKPNDPPVLHLLARMAQQQRRFPVAAKLARMAVAADAGNADFHNTFGTILGDLKQWDDAAAALREAVRLRPDFAEAWHNLGHVFARFGRLPEAMEAYREAGRLSPADAGPWESLAAAAHEAGDLAALTDGHRQVIARRPGDPAAGSALLYLLHYDPDLSSEEIFRGHLAWGETFGRGEKIGLAANAGGDARAPGPPSCSLDHDAFRSAPHPGPLPRVRGRGSRMRVGYISAGLRAHPIARFQEAEMAARDRDSHELFCYSTTDRPDATTDRLRLLADVWRDVGTLSDDALLEQIDSDGIDVLVDLDWHDRNNRLPCLARGPAPVQVTYNNNCDTTGLRAIGWKLTDAALDPPGQTERFHTERLYRLPRGMWCYTHDVDTPPTAGEPPMMANGFVTFGSLNRAVKHSPAVLRLWARVLAAVPRSRLMLLAAGAGDGPQCATYREHLRRHGIDPDRVQLVGRMPRQEYLRRLASIDVALDPFPFAGVTTTCDALWMGVPVVSRLGERLWSRSAASLLPHVGLEDLIAGREKYATVVAGANHDPGVEDQYVQIAVGLAADGERLRQLRRTLRERMLASPLCDGKRMARELAEAYHFMWRQQDRCRD